MSASRGRRAQPLAERSAVTTAVMAANPAAGSIAMRLSAEAPYPSTATHLGWPPRSAGIAAGDPHERADALVDPVQEAVRDGAEPDLRGQVQRQDRGHHLRRDVGQAG
jgi:hypothetical protein